MFIVKTVHDLIRIPPALLAIPTVQAIHSEIDQKYPNRILMDVGLVVARYGDCLHVEHGVCVAGDGGAHHECAFRLILFRPFVEEVVLGTISKSTSEGIQVSLGFFDDIYIPAYWMLNPSRYEPTSGLWVWTPQYEDDEEAQDAETQKVGEKSSSTAENGGETRYEMYLGAEIRFKVKSINFTQVTNTAKGMHATMTTTAYAPQDSTQGKNSTRDSNDMSRPVRQRSSSVGIDESDDVPTSMHIVGTICDDGLGLTSWWKNEEDEESDEAEYCVHT
jgi:DNA-directed RNA polymerase III subunit RPC8